jgi:hypothetical protein
MPLVDLFLPVQEVALPGDVRSFLREANRRVRCFLRDGRIRAFVPCDFHRAYLTLRVLAEADLAPGNLFCEWGSGFGVVACLASMLDFDACGIEIEPELVDAAQELADDFGLPVEFVCGSFIPEDYDAHADRTCEYAWLTTEGGRANDDMRLDPDDFDIVFAYPWPDEEELTGELFEQRGRTGALLLTYQGADDLGLRRKIGNGCSGRPRQKG